MALTFKQKITGAIVLSAMVPMLLTGAVAAYLSYNTQVKTSENSLALAEQAVRLRVEDFLNIARLQVQENAQNPLVHTALREFSRAADEFDASAIGIDTEKLKGRYIAQREKIKDAKAGDEDGWMPKSAKAQVMQHLYISANEHPLGEKQKLDDAGDGSAYSAVHAKYHNVFRSMVEKYEYYDYFLVDADSGNVVYTNFKEIDFFSNVNEGPLAESAFSRVVRKALASTDAKAVFFSDIEAYMPSYNDPAIFVASPVIIDGKTVGVVALQLPTGKMNGFFTKLKELGETVDGYVAGADLRFKTPQIAEDGKAGDMLPDSIAKVVKGVVSGEKVEGMYYYDGGDGKPMEGKFEKLNVEGLDWVVGVGIDTEELMAPTIHQLYVQGGIMLAMMAVLGMGGVVLSGGLVRPIIALAMSFKNSSGKVQDSTNQVTDAVGAMIAASEETAAQSKIIRKNSGEAAGYVKSVAQAVGELNVSINDISQSIGEANALIDDAVERAKQTDEVVRNLGDAANKITEVVSLINGLAEQTNLLALNAAIEAARAGDAGRGFAVVADEVKKLATHTSNATVDIQDQIKNIQDVAEKSVNALQGVVEGIHRIRDSATTVSAAVEEQSGVAKQIAASVDDAANRVQEVDTNMNGIEQAANDTGVAADQVSGAARMMQDSFKELEHEVGGVLNKMGVRS